MLDVSGMLRELAAWGWKPVLHEATPDYKFATETLMARGWVCYPQGEVRAFHVGQGDDPGAAVLALYLHARAHQPAPARRTEDTVRGAEAIAGSAPCSAGGPASLAHDVAAVTSAPAPFPIAPSPSLTTLASVAIATISIALGAWKWLTS